MKDFSKIIDAARNKHLRKAVIEQQSGRQDADERAALRRVAIGFLDREIRPHLKAAQQQLRARNFPLRIEDNWTTQPVPPERYHIAVVIEGPEQQNAFDGVTTPRSRTAFFIHNGKSFSLGYSKDNSGDTDHPDKPKPSVASEAERKVEEVIELLLDGYLDDVERYRSSGTW